MSQQFKSQEIHNEITNNESIARAAGIDLLAAVKQRIINRMLHVTDHVTTSTFDIHIERDPQSFINSWSYSFLNRFSKNTLPDSEGLKTPQKKNWIISFILNFLIL